MLIGYCSDFISFSSVTVTDWCYKIRWLECCQLSVYVKHFLTYRILSKLAESYKLHRIANGTRQ